MSESLFQLIDTLYAIFVGPVAVLPTVWGDAIIVLPWGA